MPFIKCIEKMLHVQHLYQYLNNNNNFNEHNNNGGSSNDSSCSDSSIINSVLMLIIISIFQQSYIQHWINFPPIIYF